MQTVRKTIKPIARTIKLQADSYMEVTWQEDMDGETVIRVDMTQSRQYNDSHNGRV